MVDAPAYAQAQRDQALGNPPLVYITVDPEDVDDSLLTEEGVNAGRLLRAMQQFQGSEVAIPFALWDQYEADEPVEVTDKRTNTGRFVGMPLRVMPRTLNLSLHTSIDGRTVLGVPVTYKAEIALLRSLKGVQVTATTDTIPFFEGIVRQIRIQDDGRFRGKININVEIRELLPSDFGDSDFPERVRLKIPRESFDPDEEEEEQETLNNDEVCNPIHHYVHDTSSGPSFGEALAAMPMTRGVVGLFHAAFEWDREARDRARRATPDGIKWKANARGKNCGFGVDKGSMADFTAGVLSEDIGDIQPRFFGSRTDVDFDVKLVRTIPVSEWDFSSTSLSAVVLQGGSDAIAIGARRTAPQQGGGMVFDIKVNGIPRDRIVTRFPFEDSVYPNFLRTQSGAPDAVVFLGTDEEALFDQRVNVHGNPEAYHLVIMHGRIRSGG